MYIVSTNATKSPFNSAAGGVITALPLGVLDHEKEKMQLRVKFIVVSECGEGRGGKELHNSVSDAILV